MPPTIQPPHLRHLGTLAAGTRNGLQQLVSRQGLEGGPEGPPGPPGDKGPEGKLTVGAAGALTSREVGEEIEASSTEAMDVSLVAETASLTRTVVEFLVEGVVRSIGIVSASCVGTGTVQFSFPIAPTKKWEVRVASGEVTSLRSSYAPI
jgi:hypothetical protein